MTQPERKKKEPEPARGEWREAERERGKKDRK